MLTQCNADGDVECSECGRVYAAAELSSNKCPADDCPSNEWRCRACGCAEDECECNAEDFGAEFNDGMSEEELSATDPYDIEYDR